MNKKNKKEKINNNKKDLNKKDLNKNRKKIIFWLMFFFPYGIYLAFKLKAFHPVLTAFCLFLIGVVSIGVIDMNINPYRLANKEVENLIVESEFIDTVFGKVRNVEFDSNINHDKKMYMRFSVLGTSGKYFVYVGRNKEGEKSEIKGIYKIIPTKEVIYRQEELGLYVSDLIVEISDFLNLNENKEKYGEFKKIIKTNKLESKQKGYEQTIETTTGIFKFIVKMEQVTEIYEVKNNKENLIYSKELYIKPIKKISKYIGKKEERFGTIIKVVGEVIEPDKISQLIETSKGLFKFELFDTGRLIVYEAHPIF